MMELEIAGYVVREIVPRKGKPRRYIAGRFPHPYHAQSIGGAAIFQERDAAYSAWTTIKRYRKNWAIIPLLWWVTP